MRRHGIRQARVDACRFQCNLTRMPMVMVKRHFGLFFGKSHFLSSIFFYLPYLFLFRFLVFPHCAL